MRKCYLVLLMLVLLMGLAACGKSEALIAAEEAISAIGDISLDSEDRIVAAEQAVAALTKEDLEKLKNKNLVIEARTQYDALAADHLASEEARAVDVLISAIGEVTLESKVDIDAAQKAYDKLDELARAKVQSVSKLKEAYTAYYSLQAQHVDELIAQIGNVALDTLGKVETARKAYDALSSEAKAYVKSLDTLTSAEKAIDTLRDAEKQKILKNLSKNFNIKEDKVQGIKFYIPKAMPTYGTTRSYLLPYIGANELCAYLCIRYNYGSYDWIFWENIIIMVDGERYHKTVGYFNITRDNGGGKVMECYDQILALNAPMSDSEIELLLKIANSKETIIRFQGDDYYYDLTVKSSDKQAILTVLAAYEALKK